MAKHKNKDLTPLILDTISAFIEKMEKQFGVDIRYNVDKVTRNAKK